VKGKRFLSIEPQIEFIDLLSTQFIITTKKCQSLIDGISWIIQGGESGHRRRPFNLNWAYSMKEQCQAANVPYFFKQIDQVYEKKFGMPKDLQIQQFPKI